MHSEACKVFYFLFLYLASIVPDCKLDEHQSEFDPRHRQMIFPVSSVYRPAVRTIQPPIQWIQGSFPGGKARTRRDADHSSQLVPWSRMSRICISSPPFRLHCGSGQLYFYITITIVHEPNRRYTNSNLLTIQLNPSFDISRWFSTDTRI
jgi:hypothetical protein